MQIQISWLLQKPTDLDLHCLLRQGMSCSAKEGLKVPAVILSDLDLCLHKSQKHPFLMVWLSSFIAEITVIMLIPKKNMQNCSLPFLS